MIVLSLDQAMVTTGWAIFDDKSLTECGSFTVKSTLPIDKRLGEIQKQLTELSNKIENIDMLVFEDIQQQQNVQTYKKLAYCQATILLWCYYNNIPYMILSPTEWRKLNGGEYGKKREEQKEAAIEKVKTWYGIQVDSDIADAVNIGRAAMIQKEKNKSAF